MSQPPSRVIVSHLIVPIVRTPLPIALSHVCVLPLSVAIVTIPVPDSLLSTPDYCSPSDYCSAVCLMCSPIVPCPYCLLPLIVLTFLLSLLSIVLLGLLPSTG
jgi:hypothetical protein